MRKRSLLASLLLFLLVTIVISYVFFPLINGLLGSFIVEGRFTLSRYGDLLGKSEFEALWNSVVVSLLTVFFGTVLGSLIALALSRNGFPFARLARTIALVPIAMPPLVGVIAFLFVFGEGGILPRGVEYVTGLDRSFLAVEGYAAVVIVHVYSFHVYTYLFVSGALREIDSSLLEAASILGASTPRILRRIVFPELLPALTGAASLTFMSSMASFSAPFILGGGLPFLTTQIYSTKLNGDIDLAGAQSALLMFVSILFFVFLTSSEKRRQGGAGKGVQRKGMVRMGRGLEGALITIVVVLLLVEMLPLLTVGLISFAKEGSWTTQILPGVYTVANYQKLWSESDVFVPIQNSLAMSMLAVAAAVVSGTAIAASLAKGTLRKFRRFLDPFFSMPFAVPGTVTAIYLIYSYSTPGITTAGYVLLGTFWILPLAYFIRTYPLVLRSVSSSLEKLDDSILEAAQLFGSGPYSNFRKITYPIILPGIVAGSLLVFITSLGEFPASVLLYAHSNRPISVEILAQLRGYNFGSAAAYSVGLLVLIIGVTRIADIFVRSRRGAGKMDQLWS